MQLKRLSRRQDEAERMMSLRLFDKNPFLISQDTKASGLFHLIT